MSEWKDLPRTPELDLLMDWPELKFPSPPQEQDLELIRTVTLSSQPDGREDTGWQQSPLPPIHHTSLPVYPGSKDNLSPEIQGTSTGNLWLPPQRKFPSLSCEGLSDPFTLNSQDQKLPKTMFGKKLLESKAPNSNLARKPSNEIQSPTGSWFGTVPSPVGSLTSKLMYEFDITGNRII